jgi:hypothetical protein
MAGLVSGTPVKSFEAVIFSTLVYIYVSMLFDPRGETHKPI